MQEAAKALPDARGRASASREDPAAHGCDSRAVVRRPRHEVVSGRFAHNL